MDRVSGFSVVLVILMIVLVVLVLMVLLVFFVPGGIVCRFFWNYFF